MNEKIRLATSFSPFNVFYTDHHMRIPWDRFSSLLPRAIKLCPAFLKKQRLKYSNILFYRFKTTGNTLELSVLWCRIVLISYTYNKVTQNKILSKRQKGTTIQKENEQHNRIDKPDNEILKLTTYAMGTCNIGCREIKLVNLINNHRISHYRKGEHWLLFVGGSKSTEK